jgi:hypothetical protein
MLFTGRCPASQGDHCGPLPGRPQGSPLLYAVEPGELRFKPLCHSERERRMIVLAILELDREDLNVRLTFNAFSTKNGLAWISYAV